MQCRGEKAEFCTCLEKAIEAALGSSKHWGDNVLICSQETFLFPLIGIWGTTPGAISCVCGALEDSRTVTGHVTLEIKAVSGFGTTQASMKPGPGGGTRLVGIGMGRQSFTGHSLSPVSG